MKMVAFNEDFLENSLLSKSDLAEYDLDRTFYNVVSFMAKYKRLRCKCVNEPQIRITTKYQYTLSNDLQYNENNYTSLDKYIDNKTEYRALSEKILLVMNLLTAEEKVYFTIVLFNGNSESSAFKEIGCSNKGLIPIKNSCIVKFACAFDLEVYKSDTFHSVNDEESFIKYCDRKY